LASEEEYERTIKKALYFYPKGLFAHRSPLIEKNQKGNRRIFKHRTLSLMQNPAIFITSTGERAEINDSEWVGKAKSQNDNIHRRATKSKPDLWVTNDIYLRKAVESAVNTSCDPP
jgi:hypothetical protein